MTFYDYDMTFDRDGNYRYVLRANCKPLPAHYFCTVRPLDGGGFERVTQWGAKGGRRYSSFRTEDDALLAGVAWARRREQQDKQR